MTTFRLTSSLTTGRASRAGVALLLSLTACYAMAASNAPANVPAKSSANLSLVELEVDGLNCALCSEAMKSALKSAAGAKDIEPRLECGRIYLEVAQGVPLNEAAVNFTLLANGFNLKGTQPSAKTMAQVRANKTC